MMRVLVLGGTGFIGSHLVAALRADKNEVVVFGSSRNPAQDLTTVQELPPGPYEVVYNCVGEARLFVAEREPAYSLGANVLTVINALTWVKENSPKSKFVHLSSDMRGDQTVYGQHKLLAEWHVRNCGLSYYIVCPSSVFGRGEKKGPVLDACRYVFKGEPLRFYKFEDVVKITYVGNVVEALIKQLSVLSWERPVSEIVERFRRVPQDELDHKLATVKEGL